MFKAYIALVGILLACSHVQAQGVYSSEREARYQRNFDNCVYSFTKGRRVSRRDMRDIREDCRRRLAAREERRMERRSRY